MRKKKFFLLMLIIFSFLLAWGQDKEYTFKAAYIERFTRFIKWKNVEVIAKNQEFVIGVFGSNPFNNLLNNLNDTQTINDKPIKTQVYKTVDDIQHCDILFVPKYESKKIGLIAERDKLKNTIIISEYPGLALNGADINFFINSEGKIRFEINRKKLEDRGIKLDLSILEMAIIVGEK